MVNDIRGKQMMNRPWSIWWDFRWEGDHIVSIVVQTDHPKYTHVDYIYCFPIKECEDEFGYVDTWVENWFTKFRDDVMGGRQSLHKIIKSLDKKS
jgi:hypothetical protein